MSKDTTYRDDPAIAQSDLKLYYDNPMAFYLHKILGEPIPDTTSVAMTFGNLMDAMILGRDFVEIPPDVLSKSGSKAGKKWQAFKAAHEGQTLVTLDEVAIYDQVRTFAQEYHPRVYNALWKHERRSRVRLYWECPTTGINRKGELDLYLPEHKMAIDLKTTQDPTSVIETQWIDRDGEEHKTLRGFNEDVWKYGYHLQAATYMEGLRENGEDPQSYCIIAIRNSWPYDCEIYELSAESLAWAADWNRKWMCKLAEDIQRDEWLPVTAQDGRVTEKLLTRPSSWAGKRWDREP